MKSYLASLAYFAATVAAGHPSPLLINTPSNVIECEPLLITWCGGKAPYTLEVVPGTDPTLSPIESLGEYTANEATWVVNLASGTYIVLTLKDSLGDLAQTAPVIVEPGISTACLSA